MNYEKAWKELKKKLNEDWEQHVAKNNNHTLWEGAYQCRTAHIVSEINRLEIEFKEA
jgi:hypothetical protein